LITSPLSCMFRVPAAYRLPYPFHPLPPYAIYVTFLQGPAILEWFVGNWYCRVHLPTFPTFPDTPYRYTAPIPYPGTDTPYRYTIRDGIDLPTRPGPKTIPGPPQVAATEPASPLPYPTLTMYHCAPYSVTGCAYTHACPGGGVRTGVGGGAESIGVPGADI
jgi:hypothetical protein